MLEPATCIGMGFGAPRVAVSTLVELHHLLIVGGFRRSSRDDPTIVQGEQDEKPAATGAASRSPRQVSIPLDFGRRSTRNCLFSCRSQVNSPRSAAVRPGTASSRRPSFLSAWATHARMKWPLGSDSRARITASTDQLDHLAAKFQYGGRVLGYRRHIWQKLQGVHQTGSIPIMRPPRRCGCPRAARGRSLQPQVRPVAGERPIEEGIHPLVDILTQLADGALADSGQTHGLHQGLSSIKLNDRGGEVDGGQKVARGLVVAGGDGSELLEFAEEVLDQVTLLIEVAVEFAGFEAV